MLRLVNPDLVSAISGKRLIEFAYKGGQLRIAEPHDYGVRRGVEAMLVYQISGDSSSGAAHGWKHLEVEKMSQLSVLDRKFQGPRGDSGQHHGDWDTLFARVK